MSEPQSNTYTVTVKNIILFKGITSNFKFEQPFTAKLIDVFYVIICC